MLSENGRTVVSCTAYCYSHHHVVLCQLLTVRLEGVYAMHNLLQQGNEVVTLLSTRWFAPYRDSVSCMYVKCVCVGV